MGFRKSASAAVFAIGLIAAPLAHANGAAYEYKILKSRSVNLTGLNLGKSRQMGLEAVEREMREQATDGWRLATTSLVAVDNIGTYAFVMVFERQIGGTTTGAQSTESTLWTEVPEPTPIRTPFPDLPPRPAPTDEPCAADSPCIVESHNGTELTVTVGKRHGIRLKSGDVIFGTVTAARRSRIEVDLGKQGARSLGSAEIASIWVP